MKIFFDFLPLIVFFGAYKFYGIFVATGIAIVASIIQVGVYWSKHRKFETAHLVTLAVIVVFGGLTLAFRDDTFIKWKPTIVNWLFAVMVIGSQMIGRKTALEHLLGSQLELPKPVWRRVNMSWGLFFLVLGVLNIYVAFFFRLDLDEQARTDLWVNFKVFGLMALTLVFTIVQMVFIAKHIAASEEDRETRAP